MKRASFILAAALLTGTANAQSDQSFRTLGPGAGASCGRWLQDRRSGREAGMTVWALGFLSAVAIYHERDILRDIDADGIRQWLDNYCREDPLRPFAQGLQVLADNRLRQSGR